LGVGYICYGAQHFRDLVRHIGQKAGRHHVRLVGQPAITGSASMMVPKYEKSTDCVPETRADKYI
jgi:hypothetical protein